MEKLIRQIANDKVWVKWVAANSSEGAGCISNRKEGCISVAKKGCISISTSKSSVKAGCIS